MLRSMRPCVLATLFPLLASVLSAQCATNWAATVGASAEVLATTTWDPDGDGPLAPRLVFGGSFTFAGGIAADRVVVWDPASSTLGVLGDGLNGSVHALAARSDGDLFAGGVFTGSGATPLAYIARWDGVAWQPLTSGITGVGFGTPVRALVAMPNGEVVVAGAFTEVGGVPANNVARWDGANWSTVGSGVAYPGAYSALLRSNGDLLIGTQGGVRRFDGSAWSSLGVGALDRVLALVEQDNGDIVAGGTAGVSRWNGTSWTALGSGFGGGFPLLPFVGALAVLPDGDLVAGGQFSAADGVSLSNVARWQGSTWQPFGAGTNAAVHSLRFDAGGSLWVGGAFTAVDGIASNRLARLTSGCPATANDFAAGCAGNTLTATSLPWVDAALHIRGSGLPASALVVADTGIDPIVPGFPLDSVFAEAPAGCLLHLVPLIEQLHVSTTGTVDSSLFLPNTPPLVGVTFYQQMFAFEIDAGLGITAITATNVLQMTAGDW